MLSHLTNLLTKWSPLPLARMHRLTAAKMAILPKILYLIRVLPIPVPGYYLYLQQRWISSSTLYLSKIRGGFCILQNTSMLLKCFNCPSTISPQNDFCVALESVKCEPLSVANFLWLQSCRAIHSTVMRHSLSLWDRLKSKHIFQSHHNPMFSFLCNS